MARKPSCDKLEKRIRELEAMLLKGKEAEQKLPKSNRTTVQVLFPISDVKIDKAEVNSEILVKGSEHILFVDDEPSLVKIAVSVLEQQGYRITGLTSSSNALKLFCNTPDIYGLVITDMSMPEIPGDMLIREIRKIRSNIPAILSSGHSDKISREKVRSIPVNAYTVKPFKRIELLKTIRDVLDKVRV